MTAAFRFTFLSVAPALDARDLKDFELDLVEALSLGILAMGGAGKRLRWVFLIPSITTGVNLGCGCAEP
jgi:hypothetical protein